jgi:predicted transcriptional regulator
MDIKKAIDQAYLRGQVIALYKLKVNMQDTINKLEDQIKEDEKNERNSIQGKKSKSSI